MTVENISCSISTKEFANLGGGRTRDLVSSQTRIQLRNRGRLTNSVDPDLMLHFAASDLGLHCLLRPAVPIFRVIRYLFFHAKQTLILNDNINVKDRGSTYHSGASDGETCLLISCYDWV